MSHDKALGKYICIEGIDGVGKTTQVKMLYDFMCTNSMPASTTSEPGSKHCPLTMELRSLILDAKYKSSLTDLGREYLLQAARSINLEKVVYPALFEGSCVICDRGVVSGLSYGSASGLDMELLQNLFTTTVEAFCKLTQKESQQLYDIVIILEGSNTIAQDKKEFVQGDVIEMRGSAFMDKVKHNMHKVASSTILLCPFVFICVDGKDRDTVHKEICTVLLERGIIKSKDI